MGTSCQKEPRLRSLRLQLWSHVFWKKEPHIWKKCRLAALATLCTFLHGWNEHCPFLFGSATWKKGTFLTEYCLLLQLEALEKLVGLFRGSLHFLSRMRTLNRAAVSRGRWLFLVNIPLFLKKTLRFVLVMLDFLKECCRRKQLYNLNYFKDMTKAQQVGHLLSMLLVSIANAACIYFLICMICHRLALL